MADAALMYFGNESPNGSTLSAQELDILRTAFEIAFDGQSDEEISAFFPPEVVWRVGRRIEEAYAFSAPVTPA